MGKAKTMGALALTALMGMGAAGQMNGTAEARTLDSSASKATKSISKEMVVSTTDDSDGVMSYKDKTSGKSFVSEDNGQPGYRKKRIIAVILQSTMSGGLMMSTRCGWNRKRKHFRKWQMSIQGLKPAKELSCGHKN